MSMVKNEDFKIIKGEDKLKLYQFHSKIAKHYFCSNCGIYTHHNPRANPAMTGFNLGCVDEINTFELENVAKLCSNCFTSSPKTYHPLSKNDLVLAKNWASNGLFNLCKSKNFIILKH